MASSKVTLEDYHALEASLSAKISKPARRRIFRKLRGLRSRLFRTHEPLLKSDDDEEDHLRVLATLPYGHDTESAEFLVRVVGRAVDMNAQIRGLPVRNTCRYVRDKPKESAMICRYLMRVGEFDEALHFSRTVPSVPRELKLQLSQPLPCSRDVTMMILIFLSVDDLTQHVALVNHWFAELLRNNQFWTTFKATLAYQQGSTLLTPKQYVRLHAKAWTCAWCGEVRSSGLKPYVCSHRGNRVHPGEYALLTCDHCHQLRRCNTLCPMNAPYNFCSQNGGTFQVHRNRWSCCGAVEQTAVQYYSHGAPVNTHHVLRPDRLSGCQRGVCRPHRVQANRHKWYNQN